jgi:hypothetical protein
MDAEPGRGSFVALARATLYRMSARRKILTRYTVPNTGGLVVVNHRQTKHDWYVCRPDALGRLRRAILPPFRSYGSAVLAAHYLPRPQPKTR